MARQGVITEKRTVKVTLRLGSKDTKVSTAKGIVNVPPHVRMVNGKPVYVAGYTYRR